MSLFLEMISYPFLLRALAGGIFISLCAALLGVSLVLKRYSMIGDGLSHVSFGALSVAVAVGWSPLQFSIPVVVAAAFLLLRIRENAKIKSDAAIAVISASALAFGITVTSLTTGMTTDVNSYMFGSILAMSREDVILAMVLSIVVLCLFVLFYHKVFAVTFDESFARATGVNAGLYDGLLAVLTAVTIVLGMRMMGAMLISSLIIFPALTSMRIWKSFLGVVTASGIMAVICFCIGMVISYEYSTPAGASVVLADLAAFLICMGIQTAKGRERTKRRREERE
ncbi:MAG TPA: metal ABC transporter permease [Candidatus Lachnoclostridium stercoravium]|uniref:Metal ABC transporter permease n=1 Tax=Candidatus Lachnoclostridium stercoravium TaxID=2838633 RepID=A0A9D2KL69_9FIRM|nr:metal ABC transporter permease [Candidatus Lachnoclostridium stercoravium]